MAHFACPPACCALPVCLHLMRPSSPALPPAAIVPVPLLVCPPFCSPRLVCLPVFCALSPAWSCAPSPACPPACCCPHTCPSACLSPLLLSSPRLNPRLTPRLLRSPWLPPLMCLSSPALPPAHPRLPHCLLLPRRHRQLNPACLRRPGVAAFRRGGSHERELGRTAPGDGVCAVLSRGGLLQLCLPTRQERHSGATVRDVDRPPPVVDENEVQWQSSTYKDLQQV